MNLIIGLIGAKQAGKTTAYETMSHMAEVQEITLAKKLKDVCAEVLGVHRTRFDSPAHKELEFEEPVFLTAELITSMFMAYGIAPDYDTEIRQHIGKILLTPRHIAQYMGTEVLRAVEPDIHCRSAVEALHSPIGVVTDMRFPNEFEYFAKQGGNFIPVYIKNVGAEIEAGKDTHASEAHLKTLASKALITIENDRSLKIFQDRVRIEFQKMLLGVTA